MPMAAIGSSKKKFGAWLAAALAGALLIFPLLPQTPRANFVASPFVYSWNSGGVLYEAGSIGQSTSPYWWVNSGAKLIIQNDAGQTIHGSLGALDLWRITYSLSNPVDTDNGYHPQNIFRLVSRSSWGNVRVTVPFKIDADNFSASPNRNASNGLLLMSRYGDNGDTLYYAGIRVDGGAVIKKKYRGTYYTLAQQKIFPGSYAITPSSTTSRDLLPHGEWITLRSDTISNADGSVTIRLFMQREGFAWTKILETKDTGASAGNTVPIKSAGYSGIRTDFMDVRFGTIRIETISP
ncbi:MAG: hypothetical protein RLZZ416_566 [Candidatus Parcubacteria bacterium]